MQKGIAENVVYLTKFCVLKTGLDSLIFKLFPFNCKILNRGLYFFVEFLFFLPTFLSFINEVVSLYVD